MVNYAKLKELAMNEKDISRKLKQLFERIKDKNFLIWAYCCLNTPGMQSVADIKERVFFECIFKDFERHKATNSFMRQIFGGAASDFDYNKYYQHCRHKFTNGLARLIQGDEALAELIDPGLERLDGQPSRKYGGLMLAEVNSAASLNRYAEFQNIYLLFKIIENTQWQTVEAAMQDKKPVADLPAFAEADPLSFNLPEHDQATVIDQAKKLAAKDYGGLSSFGLAQELDAVNAITTISDYLTRRAVRPGQTLEQIDAIMDNAAVLRNTQFVQEDPGRLARMFGASSKIRMTDIAETPFKPLLDLANGLPVKAGADKERYDRDIAVLTRGKEIAAAYYTLFGDMYDALKAEQPRLTAEADMFSSGVANVIETRLGALQDARQGMMLHALSFDRLAATIGITMGRLGAMAATASKIHTPIINAMTVYQLYALRRMNAFGQAVDAQVLKSVNLTQDALTDIASATPDKAKTNIGQALDLLIQGCKTLNEAFQTDIECQTQEIRALGEQLMLGAPENTRQALPVPSASMPVP